MAEVQRVDAAATSTTTVSAGGQDVRDALRDGRRSPARRRSAPAAGRRRERPARRTATTAGARGRRSAARRTRASARSGTTRTARRRRRAAPQNVQRTRCPATYAERQRRRRVAATATMASKRRNSSSAEQRARHRREERVVVHVRARVGEQRREEQRLHHDVDVRIAREPDLDDVAARAASAAAAAAGRPSSRAPAK